MAHVYCRVSEFSLCSSSQLIHQSSDSDLVMFTNPSDSVSLYGQYLKPQSLPTVPQPVAPVPVRVSLDAQCIGEGTVLGCPPGPAFSPPPPQPFSSLAKSGHVAPIGNPSRGGPGGLLVGDKQTESKASYTSLGESKHPSRHLGASKKPSSPSFSNRLGVSKNHLHHFLTTWEGIQGSFL